MHPVAHSPSIPYRVAGESWWSPDSSSRTDGLADALGRCPNRVPRGGSVRLVRFRLSIASLAALLAVALLALALSAPASAGTIVVTTSLDQRDGSAPCSLREAVDTANADANSGGCTDANPAAADTIKLAGGDYNLRRAGAEDANASGDLDVSESLTISGAGADLTGI